MDDPLNRLLEEASLFPIGQSLGMAGGVTPDSNKRANSTEFKSGFFDEQTYLQLHPDVAEAVQRGDWATGYEHYTNFGCMEGRNLGLLVEELRRSAGGAPESAATVPEHSVDAVMVSEGGGVLLIGWLNDLVLDLDQIQVAGNGWRLRFDKAVLARTRRTDVEKALGTERRHRYGFWGFVFAGRPLATHAECNITVTMRNGAERTFQAPVLAVDDEKIRETVLGYVANSQHLGNPVVEGIRGFENLNGGQIIKLNVSISRKIVSAAYVEHFRSGQRRYDGSIIVCLYKKPEYLFLQMALFAEKPGIENYEFIFVSNSPEIAEPLLKEARIAYLTYGLDISLVLLPGNAGFGAANNAAASFANSDRLLIINPDVVPRDADWAAKHSAVVADLPEQQTRIFGVPLYYDDGSLMHGGMHFEIDPGLSIGVSDIECRNMLRVEHDGKGAPPWATQFIEPRPVPAVTGAFISVDRKWFHALGGFSEEYVFGHYEDADLCLKSARRGTLPWLHDIKLWHLEGQGSTRLPVHEAATTVNRWLFSKRWGNLIAKQLRGDDLRFDRLREEFGATSVERPLSLLPSDIDSDRPIAPFENSPTADDPSTSHPADTTTLAWPEQDELPDTRDARSKRAQSSRTLSLARTGSRRRS